MNYYYRHHHQGHIDHNQITCTECLPQEVSALLASSPHKRSMKLGTRTWHKLRPAYINELLLDNPARIICDYCRNDGKATI